jgi:TusA-related sulfurtransferase
MVAAAVCSVVMAESVVAGAPGDGRGPGLHRLEGVTRTVTNTENGVLIEVSSDDADVVTLIQSRHPERPEGTPRREAVERKVTNIENGVAVDITSDDPEVVQRIQKRFAETPDQGFRKGRKGPGQRPGHRRGRGFRKAIEGAERTVTHTETGVLIEISSDDPDVIDTIQARFADRDETERRPALRKHGGRRGPGKGHGRKGEFRGRAQRRGPRGFGLMRPIEGAERTVTNTESGVRVEVTSDDPEVVAAIQERFANLPPAGPCRHDAKHPEADSEADTLPSEP